MTIQDVLRQHKPFKRKAWTLWFHWANLEDCLYPTFNEYSDYRNIRLTRVDILADDWITEDIAGYNIKEY